MSEVNQVLEVKFDHSVKPKKNWLESSLESKGKPLWEGTITINGHEIRLVNYDEKFEFTPTHEAELTDFITRADTLNPQLMGRFKRLIFYDEQPPSRYKDETKFPSNGTNMEDGSIVLFKRGHQTDIRHRTGKISNFQGTIAHECFHFLNNDYKDMWKEAFGWHSFREFPDDWEFEEGFFKNTHRNKKTGWIAYEGQFTLHPEQCVTDYSKITWDDDFADSGVVALFEPEKLNEICPQKLTFIKGIK